MTEAKDLLDQRYKQLYSNYYAHGGDTTKKRQISAAQTVQYMRNALQGQVFERVLDVGAGDGNVLAELATSKLARELFAVEISESGVQAIQARNISSLREARVFDGYTIPYPDDYFDLAICVHVLEHVEHERLFLKEIARVSRRLYIEVPLEYGFKIERSVASGKRFGHINFYSKATLASVLESSGLTVLDCRVVPSTREYEQFLSGRVAGSLKNAIRSGALSFAPSLAPWFMVYNGYAYCDTR